jgi:hypothetical protein
MGWPDEWHPVPGAFPCPKNKAAPWVDKTRSPGQEAAFPPEREEEEEGEKAPSPSL